MEVRATIPKLRVRFQKVSNSMVSKLNRKPLLANRLLIRTGQNTQSYHVFNQTRCILRFLEIPLV